MRIVKLAGSFILYLFIYSFIGIIIDVVFQNKYNDVTYAIRRVIQLALNLAYLFYITRTRNIRLTYKIKPLNIILYIVVLFAFIIIYESTIDVFINRYFVPDAGSQIRDSYIDALYNYPVALFIQTCISAPLLEEILVRGVFYEILRERLSVAYSVVISSVFFSIMHFDSFNTLFYIMISLIFSFIYVKTGSIAYCVILHVCVNTFSLLSYYMNFTPGASMITAILVISTVIILSVILYLITYNLKRACADRKIE